MRNIDRRTMHEAGVPGLILMENAGRAVAEAALSLLGNAEGKKVVVYAGKGNNGGDGFVAARHLLARGAITEVVAPLDLSDSRGDARVNYDAYVGSGGRVTTSRSLSADLVIDALLGTGFLGEVTGAMAEAIREINRLGCPVIAVDIPSGVNADTGQVGAAAVLARKTVSLGLAKPGLFLYPGRLHSGEIHVADITIPRHIIDTEGLTCRAMTLEDAAQMLLPRPATLHKGQAGRVVVVAGSPGYTGAAALTAQALLKTGAGLVTLFTPESVWQVLSTKLTEAMVKPLPCGPEGCVTEDGVSTVMELVASADCVALGPGLGRAPGVAEFVHSLMGRLRCPVVLDADGLWALSRRRFQLPEGSVITPHAGEFARLTGMHVDEISRDKLGAASSAARDMNCTCLLKGADTVVAAPDGRTSINTTGNPGMAQGGMGDALTGIIAALIAEGHASFDAACLGAFLHGMAHDLAGGRGRTAGDLIAHIPQALAAVEKVRT